jgi:hypothetical protein
MATTEGSDSMIFLEIEVTTCAGKREREDKPTVAHVIE